VDQPIKRIPPHMWREFARSCILAETKRQTDVEKLGTSRPHPGIRICLTPLCSTGLKQDFAMPDFAIDGGRRRATLRSHTGTKDFTCSPLDTPATASGGVIYF
jgi:hypothetical protein